MKPLLGKAQGAHIDGELLSSYLDGQVTREERARIEQHLRLCAACQTELQSLRNAVALLRALPRVPVPRAFTLSEAKLGVRRPAAGAPAAGFWWGGLARVMGVVAALMVIGVVSFALLRSPAFSPTSEVARTAPTPTTAALQATGAGQPTEGVAPAVAPSGATTTTAPAAAAAPSASERAGGPTAEAFAENAAPTAETLQAPATEPAETPAAKAAGPAPSPSTLPRRTPTEASEPSPAPSVPPAARSVPAPAASPAATAETMAAAEAQPMAPLGMGGGGPGAMDAARTPSPAPAAVAPGTVMQAGAGFAYADGQTLWTLDGESGQRQVLSMQGVSSPQISGDRQWIVFRNVSTEYAQLYAVRWGSSNARLLLDEKNLPKDDLGTDGKYLERRLVQQDIRWVPGSHVLTIRTVALPAVPTAPLLEELWNLDVDSGELRRVVELGMGSYFLYSPDGSQFAVLYRGNNDQPQGKLTLYDADGSNERTALEFKANQFSFGYDSQLSWLPDARGLWVAIPDPTSDYGMTIGTTTLYRVNVEGGARAVGRARSPLTLWSPDGQRLGFTRPVTDTMENMDIVIAAADGSGARAYTSVHFGMLIAWAPDSKHFIYQDAGQTHLGAVGEQPVTLSGLIDPTLIRWLGPSEMLYPWDQGATWAVVYHPIGGEPATIATIPAGATYDLVAGK